MDSAQEKSGQKVKTEISSTLTAGSQVLINARFLSGNENLQLRDLHQGNHYSAQRDVNLYLANKDLFESGTDEQRRTALLNSLQYDGENAKRDQLDLLDIGPDNFSWVKSSPIHEWLQQGTTPFWISGKPGSGKSTLMRYLSDTRWVREELQRGSNKVWKILHFFFDFRSGTGDANHLRGTFKSFLQQMIRSDKDVADFLLKPENDTIIKQSSTVTEVWIQLIADATNSTETHFCAFVDGLDEHEGSLSELCNHLQLLSDRTGIKLCIASRPEAAFRESFTEFQTIALQDYNGDSIQRYIRRRFARHVLFAPGTAKLFTDKLQIAIQGRARGIVLWARLAVDHLLRLCDTDTSEEDIHGYLDCLQPEIESLYTQTFLKIPQQYQADAAWLLCLVALRITRVHPIILFQAISFTRGSMNSFLGGDLSLETMHFRSKAMLGNLLDFVTTSRSSGRTRPMDDNLPHGWEVQLTNNGTPFYMDHNTGIKSWLHPNVSPAMLPPGWGIRTEPKSGRTYFVHHQTRRTTWDDPREQQLVSIKVIHYTLAAYVTDSNWIERRLSGADKSYSSRRLWPTIFASVLVKAEQDNAIDLDASQTAFAGVLINSQSGLHELSQSGSWITIRSDEWLARADLLRHSIYSVGTHLLNKDAVVGTRLEQSKILTLNVLRCHSCEMCITPLSTLCGQQTVSRMQSLGHYDLVFACLHGLGMYIMETVSSTDIEQESLQLMLNLLLSSEAAFQEGIGYELIDIFEKLSSKGVSMQAQHMCIFDSEYIGWQHMRNLTIASRVKLTPWVESHNPTCKLYSTSHSVLSHWALCAFDSHDTCANVLLLLLENGLTSQHSLLFDDIVESSNSFRLGGLLTMKLVLLSRTDCEPEFSWYRKNTLGRILARIQSLDTEVIDENHKTLMRKDLDAVFAHLSYFRKNKRWPDFSTLWQQFSERRY